MWKKLSGMDEDVFEPILGFRSLQRGERVCVVLRELGDESAPQSRKVGTASCGTPHVVSDRSDVRA